MSDLTNLIQKVDDLEFEICRLQDKLRQAKEELVEEAVKENLSMYLKFDKEKFKRHHLR